MGCRYFSIASKIHFLRSVSTLNLFSGDLSLTEIKKAADCTNVKTFGKSYKKQVIDKNSVNFLLRISLSIYAYR